MIKAIQDNLSIPIDEMKSYLKRTNFTNLEEQLLEDCLEVAKEQADAFCQNPFLDDLGEPVAIPQTVKVAVMQMASTYFTERNDHLSGQSVAGFSYTQGLPTWSAQRLLYPYRKLVVG